MIETKHLLLFDNILRMLKTRWLWKERGVSFFVEKPLSSYIHSCTLKSMPAHINHHYDQHNRRIIGEKKVASLLKF